ncbi:MAG: hypothetical protein ACTIJ9_11410 [Aequorivita sp.]
MGAGKLLEKGFRAWKASRATDEIIEVTEDAIKAKKKAQLKTNRTNGLLRELEVKQELIDEGFDVIGSQVSVKTKYTRRIVDHMVKDGSGNVKAIEVKNGGASRNSTQILKDNSMANDGGTVIGKNAPIDLKGKTIKINTEVRN